MALEERLELDVSEALRGVDSIGEALTQAAMSFKVGLAEALDLLGSVAVGDVDASAVTSGIDAAVQAADLAPAIEADAAGVTTAIDAAVDSADTTADVEADTSGVGESITAAVDEADTTVEVRAAVDTLTQEIDQAVADADTTIEVGADTSAATSEIEQLGGAAEESAESASNLSGALDGLGGVSQLAAGDVGGIAATLGAVNENASLVTGAVLSTAGALGILFDQALDSETAQDRFNRALGETADAVAGVSVDGFADDLESLAQNAGSSDEAMKLAAARIADLGRSAGASDESISSTAQNILLLATRLTVLNPSLGDAGDVADRLTSALARGGRATGQYGIALSAAEIEQQALADNTGKTADELTIYEKAAAGAAIVTAKLGTSLKDDIVTGSQGTQIQLRALREEFGNTLETFGEPLLDEVLAGIRTGQPLILGLAETFGELGEVAIPLLVEALEAFAPIMGTSTTLLTILLQTLQPIIGLIDAIPDPLLQAAAAMALFNRVGGTLGTTIGKVVGGAGDGLRSLPAAIGAINPLTAGLTLSVGLLAVAWQKHAKEQAESNARVREGAAALQDETQAVGDAIEAIAEKRIPENQLDDIRRMGLEYKEVGALARQGAEGQQSFIDQAEAAGEITASVADALRANGGDLRDLRVNYQQLGISQSDMNDSNLALIDTFQSLSGETQESARAALEHLSATGNLTSAQQELVDAVLDSTSGNIDLVGILSQVRGTSEEAATGTDDFTGSLDEEAVSAEDAAAALQALLDATLGFLNSQLAAERANLQFSDSLADVKSKQEALTVAVRDHGAGSVEAAAAQRDLDDAIRAARDNALSAAEAQLRLAADQATANGTTLSAEEGQRIFVTALQQAASQADGPTRAAIENLLTTAAGLDAFRQVQLRIDADTAEAERRLRSLQTIIGRLNTNPLVGVRVGNAAMAGGTFEGGASGQFIKVGERGEELAYVSPGTTMTVFPNHQTQAIESNGLGRGGDTYNVYEAVSAEATAEAIAARWELEATP